MRREIDLNEISDGRKYRAGDMVRADCRGCVGQLTAQLGEFCDPPIGKSGVNSRLRRLREIAASLREGEETNI